ncbi:hypothetical protein PHJA_002851200 [Phtheirospermum japonicum]|uniref:Uncharacterized protein n=1 Tax=Phtheirospermum japonicum TaxID=374723 RepID=A0A830D4R1_9LAMI|nr:hypothetical protein PHJA_002851200 [Phtheirospermum japonicum]
MQLASYIPVYHARDLNSRHVFDSNANNEEEQGYNISLRLYNMGQCLSYDKEQLRQIIQNHDATFRYQVQELHRLYKKQRELMDEMRVQKIFMQRSQSQTSESIHSLSHARSIISQATSWLLLGDRSHSKLSDLTSSENIHQLPRFISPNHFQECTTLHTGLFVRKNEFKFLSSRSNNGNENRLIDLELSADVPLFKEKNIFKALKVRTNSPTKVPNFRPATDSETNSVKTEGLSSFDLNNRKRCCFFDLNEPIPLESLPSSSKCPMETYTCHTEIMHNNPSDSGFLNSDGSSDVINSSVFIDLNAMPDGCFPDTETNLENMTVKMETTELIDECVDTVIDKKLVKREKDIDLNTDADLNEPPSPTARIKFAGDGDLEGPVSPENEECSPPRGASEEITQLEIPSMELETVAAETLVTICSSGLHDCLFWFAEIISVAGDDLLNNIPKLKNGASTCNDQVKFPLVSDFGPNFSDDEYALNVSCVVEKDKGTGRTSSVKPQKGCSRGTRQRRSSKDVSKIEGFLETGSSTRKTGKRACAKLRKYSKVDIFSNRVEKQTSSILKQQATRSKEGVLQSWGKIKKREDGLRRKASKFLVIS